MLRISVIAACALAVLATAASAQAAFLSVGTSNTSNATTVLKGAAPAAELQVNNGALVNNAFSLYGLIGSTSAGTGSAAVRGRNNSTSGKGFGVWGSQDGSGAGVYGTSKTGTGVSGLISSPSAGNKSAGVQGVNTSSSGSGVSGKGYIGVNGLSNGTGYGVFGQSTFTNGNGVVGEADSGQYAYGVEGISQQGYAGYFQGNVTVTNGYMQLSTATGTPPAADCNSAGQTGRMIVDASHQKLWICAGAAGWDYVTMVS